MRGLAVALVLLLTSSAEAGEKSIPDLVADLSDKDYRVRLAARSELTRRRDPAAIGPIAAALPEFDVNARTYAQGILEALPPGKTRGLFRSLLRSDDPDLRSLGAAALFRQGDPAGIPVLARDIRNVKLEDPSALRVLVRAYSLRHPNLAAAIRDRLRSPATPGLLRYLFLAVFYAQDAEAIPLLRPLASAEDVEVRMRARALLYRLDQTDVVAGLAADLADPTGSYLCLMDSLSWIRAGPAPPDALPKALVARLEAGDDASSAVQALGVLTGWKYRPAIETAEKLMEDPDLRVSRAAFTLISKLAGRSQLGSLRRSLEKGENSIRLLAAEALRQFDDESGLEVVIGILADGLVTERRDAARILGGFRRRESIPPLIGAFEDEDTTVATYALSSLQQVATALFPYRRFDWTAVGAAGNSPIASRRTASVLLRTWWTSIPEE